MKKIISLVLAALLAACIVSVVASAELDPDLGDNRIVNIFETETAPVIDGIVNEGEYGSPIAVWPTDSIMQSLGDYAENIDVAIYMTYDADNLYYAVVTECDEPHVAYYEGEHWIFNAHHVMSCIIPDDPTRLNDNDEYVYPNAEGYDWSQLYTNGYCYEWTMIHNSKTDATELADHFLTLSQTAGVKCETSSANGQDVYEISIPWSAMVSKVQTNPLKGEEGTVFGFDCIIGLTDIGDGYDPDANGVYRGNYVYFGGAYTDNGKKDIRGCALVTCAGKAEIDEPSSEPSSEPVSTPSEDNSSETSATEPTGDNGLVALAVIASIAVAGAVIVKKTR